MQRISLLLRAEDATPHGEEDVEEGDSAGEEGDADGGDGGEACVDRESRDGEDVAYEHGARVAHEDAGGVPVVAQEAEQGAREDRHDDGESALPVDERDGCKAGR